MNMRVKWLSHYKRAEPQEAESQCAEDSKEALLVFRWVKTTPHMRMSSLRTSSHIVTGRQYTHS
jgi:hypothetical protein